MKKILAFAVLTVGPFLALSERTLADTPAWMHAAANATLPAYDDKTAAVLVYSEDVTTVSPDGKTKGIERRAYRILKPEGREYAEAHAYFGRDTRIGSIKGWCVPKQGKDYEVKDKDAIERSLNMESEGIVSDMKVKILQIPAGDPGNVVGYEIQYDGRPYVLDDEWQFQHLVPVKEAIYTLKLPPGWEYKATWMNHSKVEPVAGNGNEWQWTVTNVPAIRHEREMPPFYGVAGIMSVSFFAPGARQNNGFITWNAMGKWAGDLANGRRDSSTEINKKVIEVTAGQSGSADKMRSIAGFLQKDIRYVGIELGIGGWQPHSAVETFSHRYGDCKDKATLMSTMLKQINIDSYYLYINTERGAVGPETPPMRLFNHAILAIKLPDDVKDPKFQAILDHPTLGRLLIFDPTGEKTPIGQLSGELQGSYALLGTPDGGELILTPKLPANSNGVTRTAKLVLDAQGTLQGEVTEIRKGDFAVYERYQQQAVKSSKERLNRIEQEVSRSIGLFRITEAKVSNLEITDAPFGYTYSMVAPSYAKQLGSLLALRPRIIGVKTSDILETKEPRKFPLIFPGPERDSDLFEITLPADFEVDDLPPPVDVDYSFASYHSKSEVSGGVLKFTRTYEVKELSVPLEKMDDLKKLYRIIASDERSTAVLKPKLQTSRK